MKHFFLWSLSLLLSATCMAQKLGEATLDQIVGAMSSSDKAHFVQGMGIVDTYVGSNQIAGASGYSWALDKLGVPQTVWVDGPAGVRLSTVFGDKKAYATFYPTGTALASTWNTALVEETMKALGNETLEYGCDILLAPGVNIQRHPLCGRNFEYYSEDPLVAGRMGAAYIRGVQSQGVGTSLKHFAANNQETNRKKVDSRVSIRALREIYLRPFEIAVKEAHPWTVMSSYNKLNGVKTAENRELLTTLLRDEWGFNGVVTSDWINEADAKTQIKAGNDMLMPGSTADYWSLYLGMSGIKNDINTSCKRILELTLKCPAFRQYPYTNAPDLDGHALVARRAADEAVILLKNDQRTLPLSDTTRVALFGSLAYRTIGGGTGSGNVTCRHITSQPEAFTEAGIAIDTTLLSIYEEHIKNEGTDDQGGGMLGQQIMAAKLPSEKPFTLDEVRAYAAVNDIAILTIGRSATESADRTEAEFNLTPAETELLNNVCRAFHECNKRVVVVLNVASAVETASWKAMPDAIVLPWLAGQETGHAIVDVLTGLVCPSGRLAMTLPMRYSDHYSNCSFAKDDAALYEEDVFVGYRYFDTFQQPVSYPFGYGLSYTTFSHEALEAMADGDSVHVSVRITNTGAVAGKEVAQLYVAAPDRQAQNKPRKELRAFAKTALLAPGESEVLHMDFSQDDLASFDEASHSWVTDGGTYALYEGASVADLRTKAEVDVAERIRVVNDILRPKETLNLLNRSAIVDPEEVLNESDTIIVPSDEIDRIYFRLVTELTEDMVGKRVIILSDDLYGMTTRAKQKTQWRGFEVGNVFPMEKDSLSITDAGYLWTLGRRGVDYVLCLGDQTLTTRHEAGSISTLWFSGYQLTLSGEAYSPLMLTEEGTLRLGDHYMFRDNDGFWMEGSPKEPACRLYVEHEPEQETDVRDILIVQPDWNGAIYRADGKRIPTLQRGVNIVNGKKLYK